MQYRKLGLLVITCLITLSGCTSTYDASKDNIDRYKTTTIVNNNESKETTSGDGLSSKRLSYELTDNLKIDAEVEYTGTSNCDTYHAKVKEFDADIITNAFIQDMDKMKKVENPNGLELTGDDGSSLFIGEGRFSYTSSVAEQDILYLLQGAYYSELQYQKDRANADELVQEKVVQKAIKKVETVCELEKDETVNLLVGMKVDANRVLERQQLEMEKMDLQSSIDIGKFHEVTEDMISDECYYLVLGIVKNRIPLMGTQEPALITADEDAIYQSTYIELFIDGESIRDINVMGMFTLEIQNTEELISAEEACETIREKYDMQILSESYTIDKVWLEYIYVPDTQADNMYTQGNIQPYWCFAITNEEGSYGERVNAVTGGDLAYGE